jgi:hypothetical protein
MRIGSPVENRVRQRGAIVVCVLVVLLIVGMLAAQTIQASLLVRRGDAERSQLRQARELVELGRLALQQSARDVPVSDIPVGAWNIVVDASRQFAGSIAVQAAGGRGAGQGRHRIVAKFPAGTQSEVTVTWENGR